MSYRKSSPKPSIAQLQDDCTLLLTVVRLGIRIAAYIYAHTGDGETQAWLEEWLSDARATVAKVTGP